MPNWLANLTKRLVRLAPGRYCIILTVGNKGDVSILPLGDVEFLGREA